MVVEEMRIDAEDLSETLGRFRRVWPDIADEAFIGTAVNGPLLQDIYRRTPKSLMQRYALKSMAQRGLAGADARLGKRGRLARSRWTAGLSAEDIAKIERYGQENLAKSILPKMGRMDDASAKGRIRIVPEGRQMIFSTDVPYAERMHEHGTHGQWDGSPYGRGWSTPGTDSHYISGPIAEDSREMAEVLMETIHERLRYTGAVR